MDIFINGSSCISAFDSQQKLQSADSGRFICLEPDYKLIIDARQLRRMSRIMRLGLATAIKTLDLAHVSIPEAVVTATGLGCLDDTGNFLVKMCDPDNRMMNPTAFIQSIHNTMGGQIAMYLKSNCYNNTFTQDVLSFEHALLDACLLIEEGETGSVLLGGIDELTELKHELTIRLNKAQKESSAYYGQGEGSAFFSISAMPSGVKLRSFMLSPDEKHDDIIAYVAKHFIDGENTWYLIGKNGGNTDTAYDVTDDILSSATVLEYKKYCGDYPTACAFAMWLGCEILQQNVSLISTAAPPAHIIIYHAYSNRPHSLIHLSLC